MLFGLGLFILVRVAGMPPLFINGFDFALIVFAAFRLTRLFVYDKIMQWFRDLFLENGALPEDGPTRTISDILACPWCVGVWFALLLVFFYYLTPFAWFFILVLAISGVATVVQLLANWVGWSAEYKKLKVQEHGKKS